jgi:hypothetical protein
MAKTYRITIEYTTTEDMSSGPDWWDWPELLDLHPAYETFGVWVDKVETNEDHVRYIKEQNEEFADA